MAWTKPGPGREKGSKNKRTLELEEKLASLNCDPILFMATIMMDEDQPLDLRCKMATELVQYVAPKRKAIEHTGDVGVTQFVIMGAQPDASPEDWERRNQERLQ